MSPPCNFVFDVVVTRYALRTVKLRDPKSVIVQASIGRNLLEITHSRHNVTEFVHDSRYEFSEKPKKLRDAIERGGIPVKFTYNKQVLGEGQMIFPQSLIDKIEEGMTDLLHSDTVTLLRAEEVVGTLEILCRLVIKCDNEPGMNRDCQNVNKSINPQDIMFVMGESQHCPDPRELCPDVFLPEEEGDDRVTLDLQRYQSINTNWSPDRIFMQNSAGNTACSELKQMARECEEIVDTINQGSRSSMPLRSTNSGPENPYLRRFNSSPEPRFPGPADEIHYAPMYPNFTYLAPEPKIEKVICQPTSIPVPISDINNPDIKPSRFCPVCLTNMSWLPKFAACPKCGLKPTPVLEERHKEEKLTAEQILVDYLEKKPQGDTDYCETPCEKKKSDDKADEPTECRCTCKHGKVCAHCRIRQLCADIFQADETTECPTDKPKQTVDYCTIVENSQECRPYLSRVFSELRDLYNVKENRVLTPHDRICKNTSKHTQINNQKSSEPEPKTKPKRDQEQKPKIPPVAEHKPRLGHKNCVNDRPVVSRHHGWDWISSPQHKIHGWRPGYILKPIKKLMKFFLQYLPEDTAFHTCRKIEQAEQQRRKNEPSILNVCKKNGKISITLRSVNDPNVHMQPITFNIVKSEFALALREIKRQLKDKGFRKCTCHQTLMLCVCRNQKEKRELGHALQKECHSRGMENCVNQLVLTDTSESDMEFDIDVTPPGGTVKPRKVLKRRQLNNSTQTSKKDRHVVPKYPIPHSQYYRTYDCAAGDRYRSTAFGAAGETVFEDGVFGQRGGGAHGDSASPIGKLKSSVIWGKAAGEPIMTTRDGHAVFARDKSFPGTKDKGKGVPQQPLKPVNMPKRFFKASKEAAKAKEEAKIKEELKRKKGINMMNYLQQHQKGEPVIGPDGLTDAQRRRRALFEVTLPSIDDIARKGRGYDPCIPHGCPYYGCNQVC